MSPVILTVLSFLLPLVFPLGILISAGEILTIFLLLTTGLTIAAPATSAQHRQMIHAVLVQFLFIVHFYQDPHGLAQHIDALHLAPQAVITFYLIADTGQISVQLLVGVFLIFKAAHQTAADTGNLGRIQGKVLFLGHFDGNRDKIRQIGMAAKGSAANTDTAQDLGLIPDADLAQLDPGTENPCQILYQIAEIHAAIRCKIEKDLTVIKGIFCVDELHIQLMAADLG